MGLSWRALKGTCLVCTVEAQLAARHAASLYEITELQVHEAMRPEQVMEMAGIEEDWLSRRR